MKDFLGELLKNQSSFALYSAGDFIKRETFQFELNIPLAVTGITPDFSLKVKEKLLSVYASDTAIKVIKDGGISEIPLSEFDGQAEAVFIEGALFTARKRYSFGDLVEIIRRLRDPDGCQWDRAQTHKSIRANAIEEAYELVEAIDLDDTAKMLEESGDVFLQGLFHAAIAEDNGTFGVAEMVSALCDKLVGRHTHIFGENKANNPEEALAFWEKAKAKEKGQQSAADKIDSIPATFSALMKANKIQKIAAKAGFDFRTAEDAAKKIPEETEELRTATTLDEIEEEAGDLLFAATNLVRFLKIDPEIALGRANVKFINRFKYVEKRAAENGGKITDFSDERLDEWYREYKKLYENR